MALLGYQIPKDPFSTQDQVSDIISLWQTSKEIVASGVFDNETIYVIDDMIRKALNTFTLKPKMFKKKLDDFPVDMQTTDIEVLIKVSKNSRLRYLWKGNSKNHESMDNPSTLAEGLIVGSKVIGKSILRGVGKSPIDRKSKKEAKKLLEQQLMRHPKLRHTRTSSTVESAAYSQTAIFHELSKVDFQSEDENNMEIVQEEVRLGTSSSDSDVNDEDIYRKAVSPRDESIEDIEGNEDFATPVQASQNIAKDKVSFGIRRTKSAVVMSQLQQSETFKLGRRSYSTSQFHTTRAFYKKSDHDPEIMEPILRVTKYSEELHGKEARMKGLISEIQRQIAYLQTQRNKVNDCIGSKREDIWNQERKLVSLLDTQNRLTGAVESLTSESSRLQYELVVQEEKLKEVEDAIEDLQSRISRYRFPRLISSKRFSRRSTAATTPGHADRNSLGSISASFENLDGSTINESATNSMDQIMDEESGRGNGHWFWTLVSVSITLLHFLLIQVPISVYEGFRYRFFGSEEAVST